MRNLSIQVYLSIVFILIMVGTHAPVQGTEAPHVNYIYSLARFTGPVSYQWVRLTADAQHKEVYVLNSRNRSIDIYNRDGMEVYSFNLDQLQGSPKDVAVDNQGNILILVTTAQENFIQKLSFRGDFISDIELKQLPDPYGDFSPDRIVIFQDTLFLAELGRKRILKTDLSGEFIAGFSIDELLVNVPDEDKTDVVLGDVAIDRQGRPIFTIPLLWLAGVLNPDGTLTTFGDRGDTPGKFGIINSIVSDENGLIYVSDILRSVVMVFDKEYRFLAEFGGRGGGQDKLIGPSHLAMEGNLLYVTQLRNRGVSVFKCATTPQ